MSFPKSIVCFMKQRPLLMRSVLDQSSTYAAILPARFFVHSRILLVKPVRSLFSNALLNSRYCGLSRAYHMPNSEADITNRPTNDELVQRVLKVVKAFEKLKPDQVKLDSHFMKDLGLDSLDQVEVLLAIEEEFDLEIPDDVSDRLMRASEVVAYLANRLKTNEGGAASPAAGASHH